MTRALVAAAGTGGHVFPALAVAKQLQHNGWHVDWLGTEEGRLESRVVPANGINLHRIAMTGVRGHGLLRLVKAPLLLASAVRQCQRLLKQLRPDIVVTFGGYVCAPLGIAAKLAGIPLLVHEQNAVPGMTTRLLAPIATVVMAGVPLRKKVIKRAQWVGNPLLRDIEQLAQRPLPDSASGHPIKLLVVGGSLGAQVLNEVVPEALQNIEQQLTGAHQCGEGKAETVTARYQQLNRQPLQVVEFIDDMAAAFATVAFVAFISLLVDRTYTATQYALLASLGTAGRTTLASSSGALVDWLNGDWGIFFILTAIMVIPSLIILWIIKNKLNIYEK